jgi:hypothetical protein
MESRIGMNMKKEIQGIVEIGSKPVVERRATATGLLHLKDETKQAILDKQQLQVYFASKPKPNKRFLTSRSRKETYLKHRQLQRFKR